MHLRMKRHLLTEKPPEDEGTPGSHLLTEKHEWAPNPNLSKTGKLTYPQSTGILEAKGVVFILSTSYNEPNPMVLVLGAQQSNPLLELLKHMESPWMPHCSHHIASLFLSPDQEFLW